MVLVFVSFFKKFFRILNCSGPHYHIEGSETPEVLVKVLKIIEF